MNKQTAVYSKHLLAQARMVPFAGFDMPIQYTSVKEEIASVRNNCGVFDVSHMGEIGVRGPEAG